MGSQLVRAFASLPKFTELSMPALSPTMKNGKITKWNFKVGDKVEAGDILAEIETDKSTVGYELQDGGYIAGLLVNAAADIDVGTPIVVIVPKKADVDQFANYKASSQSTKPSPQTSAPAQASQTAGAQGGSSSPASGTSGQATRQTVKRTKKVKVPKKGGQADLPAHEVLRMPSLSPTMKDGKIIKWNVKVGDKVAAGDCIAEIQTDKSAVGFEVQDDGYVAQVLGKEGADNIEVGKPIVVITKKKDSVAAFSNFTGEDQGEEEIEVEVEEEIENSAQQATTNQNSEARSVSRREGDRIIATPYAKVLARDHKIDLSSVAGSGPHGRIKADDVLKAKSQPSAEKETKPKAASYDQTAVSGNFEDIPLSQMRRVIGQRLTESKQNIPHYYVTMEIRMDKLLNLRKMVNEDLKDKLSVNDFIIKAASLACKAVPEVNSQWLGDKVRRFEDVDVSFAVAIDSGLITPIVASADSKSLSQISQDTKDLITRAKAGKLKPEEYVGGTFTISNLGMFGVKQFTAIINPPQACILAVGSTELHPVFSETAPNKVEFVNKMLVTLSSDHRVVDGAVAARWLNVFRDMLENPMRMLI